MLSVIIQLMGFCEKLFSQSGLSLHCIIVPAVKVLQVLERHGYLLYVRLSDICVVWRRGGDNRVAARQQYRAYDSIE